MANILKLMGTLLFLVGATLAHAQSSEDGIIVTGEGRVSLPPDMVTISLGVSGAGKTTSEVLDQVTSAAAAIQAKLAELGIPPEDRQTSGFYLQPVHKNYSGPTPPKITGYQAGNTITVRVRDLALSGPLLDEVISIGANGFNGLTFGLQDTAKALAKARAQAVLDAKQRAGQLAEAAGVSLGQVVRITESSHRGGPVMMEMARSSADMGSAINGGEVDVVAQVTMVFAIAPSGQ